MLFNPEQFRKALDQMSQDFLKAFTVPITSITWKEESWKLVITHTGSFSPEVHSGGYDEMVSKALRRKYELIGKGFSLTSAKLIFNESEPPIDIINAI